MAGLARTSSPDPGPVGLPQVVGGRFRPVVAMRRNMVGYAEGMWRAHGDVVRQVLGPPGLDREIWMLHHPEAASRVLSGSSWRAFAKQDPVYEEVGRWLGHGLLTAEGEAWTRQKRFVQPVFTRAAVDGYGDLVVDEVEHVVADHTRALDGPVDLGRWMQELALRVVVRALFGESADAVVPHVRRSFPVVSDTVVRRGVGVVRLPTAVPTPRILRGRAARADLFGACDGIVAARRAAGDTGGTDLLTRLLAARDGDEHLTDDEVRDQVLVFLLAGHETTSTALTFALHLLGRHPDVQDAVREEVREAVGDGRPSAAATASMPLTTAVLKETMRLYPSAPFVSRLAVADDEVMGLPVRAGTTVVLAPWTIHRHPGVWDDPLRFDPARFAPEVEAVARRHRYAWMPFGGGPRACIGQHFSVMEALLALAVVLRDHRVTAVAATDHLPVDALITLFPTEPVLARVERLP
ncbi:cytochrome P450 [Fodinibacter luteus]|uniref:Cytochrome P450 n=1 Tax=Fodinibacter luteus TaxID=552064 RepID=A0ABP8KPC9_9MICO